jgi:large subunit ribosomal protein L35
MPKMKTKSAAKKRFERVGSDGKLIKRAKAFKRKKLTNKTTKQKRGLRKVSYVDAADHARILRLLPYLY